MKVFKLVINHLRCKKFNKVVATMQTEDLAFTAILTFSKKMNMLGVRQQLNSQQKHLLQIQTFSLY